MTIKKNEEREKLSRKEGTSSLKGKERGNRELLLWRPLLDALEEEITNFKYPSR
jgi:hypothetical protein